MPDVNERTIRAGWALTNLGVALVVGPSLGVAIAVEGQWMGRAAILCLVGAALLLMLVAEPTEREWQTLSLSSPSRERPRAHGETCGKSAVMSLSERVLVCEAERGHAGTHRAGAVYFQTAEELSASPFTSST